MAQTDRTTGLVGNAAFKVPVRAASTGALTLSGEQTIDGIACVDGDRVLVKNQTDGSDNGIYVVDTGTWDRAKDFDGSYDVVKGTMILVTDGSTNANTYWRISTSNPITIDTTSLAFVQALITDLSTTSFLQAGSGAVARTGQDKMREIISVKDYGAVGDGVTDDTAAINLALAYGKDVYFPAGTYKTTGGHVQSTIGQRVFGAGHMFPGLGGTGTTIKKASGTATLWAWNGHNGGLRDLTLDGNNLGGNVLQVNTKDLHAQNLVLTGQGGTDFAMRFNSVNSSLFENIIFPDGNYGNIQTNGGSAMLYCTFNQVAMGTVTGAYAIDIANAISNTFNGLVFENPMRIGATCENNKFNGLSVETSITGTKLIEITASTAVNISFNGFRVLSTGLRTVALIDLVNAQGVHFENVHIQDLVSVGTPILFALDTVRDFVLRNATVYMGTAFDCIKCNSAGGFNLNPTVDNVDEINSAAGGAMRWFGQGIDVRNTDHAQAFYAGTFKRVTMMNVSGAIDTANIDTAAVIALSGCDLVTDAGLATMHDCLLANGQRVRNGRAKTNLVAITNGASVTIAGFVPAGTIVKGVTAYVTEVITGAGGITGFDIGHTLAAPGADQNAWGDNIALGAGTTTTMTAFTIAGPTYYTTNANGDLVLTARGANFNGVTGKVRLTMFYDTPGSATS